MKPPVTAERQARRTREELHLLAVREVLHAIAAALPLSDILGIIADMTIIAFDATTSWIMLMEDGRLTTTVSRGLFADELAGSVCSDAESPCLVAANRDRPTVLQPRDISPADPVLGPFSRQDQPVALLPLRSGGRTVGLLGCAIPSEVSQSISFLMTMADQAVAALESTRQREQLRTWQQRWDTIFEQFAEPVLVFDGAHRLVLWSKVAERLLSPKGVRLGESMEGLLAKARLTLPQGRPLPLEETAMARALRGERVSNLEEDLQGPDGQLFHLIVSAAPMKWDGRIEGAVEVWRDITERKQVEAERERLLAEVERRATELEALQRITDPALARQGVEPLIQSLLERTVSIMRAATGALMLLDQTGQELVLKATAGIPGERVIGSRVRLGEDFAGRVVAQDTIIGVRDAQADPVFSNPYIRASRIRGLLGAPLRVRERPIGVVYVGFLEAKDFRPNDELLLMVVAERTAQAIDQAQLLEASRNLQARTAQALEAERWAREQAEVALRSRDEFLGVAAHELKTPITSLRGYAELTMKRMASGRIDDPQEIRRAFETIDRQAERLGMLASQLLDVSRLDRGELQLKRQRADLVALVRRVVDTMQAGTTHHTVSLHAPPSLEARVDPARLEQVVYGLVDNAIKYSPEGGPVQVTVSAPDPETARIAVRDYGVGIPPEQRAPLFTRFYKAGVRRPAGGLGLGLYYAQQIVQLHGGRITAEFPEDGGSRFIVTLPRDLGQDGDEPQ